MRRIDDRIITGTIFVGAFLGIGIVAASASPSAPQTSYPLGKAKTCVSHYVKRTERHVVKGRSERYVACVYVAPSVPIAAPTTTVAVAPAGISVPPEIIYVYPPTPTTLPDPTTTSSSTTTTTVPPATTTTLVAATTTTLAPQVNDVATEVQCAESGGFCSEYNSNAETTSADANVYAGAEIDDFSTQVGTVTFLSADHLLVCVASVYSAADLPSNNARCTTNGGPFEGPLTVVYGGGTVVTGSVTTNYLPSFTSGGSN